MVYFSLKGENGATQDEMFRDTRTATTAAGYFLSFEESLPWHTGYVYEGHTLNRKGKGWILVVRASKGGCRYVSFFEGFDPTRCAQSLAFMAVYGEIDWKKDKYN